MILRKTRGSWEVLEGRKGSRENEVTMLKFQKPQKNGVKAPGLSHTYLSRASYICHLTSKKLVSILCNLSDKS